MLCFCHCILLALSPAVAVPSQSEAAVQLSLLPDYLTLVYCAILARPAEPQRTEPPPAAESCHLFLFLCLSDLSGTALYLVCATVRLAAFRGRAWTITARLVYQLDGIGNHPESHPNPPAVSALLLPCIHPQARRHPRPRPIPRPTRPAGCVAASHASPVSLVLTPVLLRSHSSPYLHSPTHSLTPKANTAQPHAPGPA